MALFSSSYYILLHNPTMRFYMVMLRKKKPNPDYGICYLPRILLGTELFMKLSILGARPLTF